MYIIISYADHRRSECGGLYIGVDKILDIGSGFEIVDVANKVTAMFIKKRIDAFIVCAI